MRPIDDEPEAPLPFSDDPNAWHILTPFGGVIAFFDEDSSGVRMKGARHGIAHIKDVLATMTGADGRMLSAKSCEPVDFYYGFDVEKTGIRVMPPLDVSLSFLQEEAENETSE